MRLSLAALALAASTYAAMASNCETQETIDTLFEQVACKEVMNCEGLSISEFQKKPNILVDKFKQLRDEFKDESSGFKPGAKGYEALEWIQELLTENFAYSQSKLQTAFTIKNHHAVGYDDSISRFDCEATIKFDQQFAERYNRFIMGVYVLQNAKNPNSPLAMMLVVSAFEKDLQTFIAGYTASTATIISELVQRAATEHTLKYSIQDTETGTMLTVDQNSILGQ